MKVRLQIFDDHLSVIEGGRVDRVDPGGSWRGWKYKRLRRKGAGEHNLVTKAEAAECSAEPTAEHSSAKPVLTFRGHR